MRLAIITDIHEDIVSLKDALRKIEKLKVDDIVCLGDISGFSMQYYKHQETRNAHECLELIRSNCKIVVLGNHDIQSAGIIPENSSFFNYPENWYSLDYQSRHELAKNTLWLHEEHDLDPQYSEEDKEYLRTLPEYSILKTDKQSILFSHYVYPNLSGLKKEFYTYRNEFKQHFDFMHEKQCTISFLGHSHSKGYSVITKKKFRRYKRKTYQINRSPICIGIPSITNHKKRNGFCIFDSDELLVQLIKI